MATVEATWNLRSNSAPRSLCAYPAPIPPPTSSTTQGGAAQGGRGDRGGGGGRSVQYGVGSGNPFDDPYGPSSRGRGGSGRGASTNPFDTAASPPGSHAHAHGRGGGDDGGVGAAHSSAASYAAVFGTERGALHYRSYGSASSGSSAGGPFSGGGGSVAAGGGGGGGGGRGALQPLGASRTSASKTIAAAGGGAGGAHPLHAPADLTGAVPGAVVGVIRAEAEPSSLRSADPSSSSSVSGPLGGPHQPAFLLLVDDNRGSAGSSTSNPGTYASHLVVLRNGKFAKLPGASAVEVSAASRAGGGGGGAGGGGLTPSGGGGGGGLPPPAAVGPLPRMNCANYHPRCGFVYAAGNSVMSLPAGASHAVVAALADDALLVLNAANGTGGATTGIGSGALGGHQHSSFSLRSGGTAGGSPVPGGHHHPHHPHAVSSSSAAQEEASLRMRLRSLRRHLSPSFRFASPDVLPGPGARSGGPDALCLTCGGGVAVVAVGNAFYAVPGTPVARSSGGGGPRDKHGEGRAGHHGHHRDPHHGDEAGGGYDDHGHDESGTGGGSAHGAGVAAGAASATKILSFAQSGQVHPAIAVEVPVPSSSASSDVASTKSGAFADPLAPTTSLLFLASGRECAAVELLHDPRAAGTPGMGGAGGLVAAGQARHGVATLASPILAAVGLLPPDATTGASDWRSSRGGRRGRLRQPLVAVLTSDGLVHTRSPSCVGVPLTTVEVGARPNDFFTMRALPGWRACCASYGGEGRLIGVRADTAQDLADRLMKLSIDAFGANGFPRSELAEALGASFSATSYVGPEPTAGSRNLLRQYLEAALGLGDDFGGEFAVWPSLAEGDEYEDDMFEDGTGMGHHRQREDFHASFDDVDRQARRQRQGGGGGGGGGSPSSSPAALLSGTALLCLVCSHLSPPNAALANRAAKSCSSRMGVVGDGIGGAHGGGGGGGGVGGGHRGGGSSGGRGGINAAAVTVCELVADRLLKEASSSSSVLSVSTPGSIQSSSSNRPSGRTGVNMEFVEAAVWVLRSCGRHERAIEVLQERMNSPAFRNRAAGGSSGEAGSAGHIATGGGGGGGGGGWSQIKYESYAAAHLGELWSSGDDDCRRLVLRSDATRRLLERNPRLGLGVFTASHPQNERQWREAVAEQDPLAHPSYPMKVVDLLKSVKPAVPFDGGPGKDRGGGTSAGGAAAAAAAAGGNLEEGSAPLPLESGRALAASYLESAVGISAGRPVLDEAFEMLPTDDGFEERAADVHDELSYLLLEGVIAERGDDDEAAAAIARGVAEGDADGSGNGAAGARSGADADTELGALYRGKLRRLLSWPNAKVRSERLLASLPSSFLREHALLLGRLGRHEDALRILYGDLGSLDLALEYCDARYERRRAKAERERAGGRQNLGDGGGPGADGDFPRKGGAGDDGGCAYLPLVRVALESDPDSERGTAAAIQVLALRRGSIDRGAALRLLPRDVPVSAVARPFLVPALVDSESQVRRLSVASSLLRARYVKLKRALTEAQIRSQASLHAVPALRSMGLGDPVRSSKPFRARPVHAPSSSFPEVTVVKHFFPRYLIIQAKVTNSAAALEGRTLGDVAFVVAESSDEALLPTVQVPLKTLPPKCAGSAWCVLAASPQRLDGTAVMTCELRYTVLAVDAATGAPLGFGGGFASPGLGRTYVEELQDIDARHSDFEP